MSDSNVDLRFLSKKIEDLLLEMRASRRDSADARTLATLAYEMVVRRDHRELELRDETHLMVKIELGGAIANLQTGIDRIIDRIDDRFDKTENRFDQLERRFDEFVARSEVSPKH